MVPTRPPFWRAVGMTFETCFRNPRACLALSAIYAVLTAIPNAVFGAFTPEVEFLQLSGAEVFAIGAFVIAAFATFAVVIVLVYPATTGGLSLLGEARVVNETVELGVIARRTLDRALTCTVTFLLVPVCVVLALLASVAVLLLLGVVTDSNLVAAAGIFVIVAIGIEAFYVSIRFALAIPAVMTESDGPIAALRRSWHLTRGAFWWVAGVFLITGLLGAVVGAVLSAVAGIISVGAAAEFVVAAVRNVIAGVVSISFGGVALGVVYAARALPGTPVAGPVSSWEQPPPEEA